MQIGRPGDPSGQRAEASGDDVLTARTSAAPRNPERRKWVKNDAPIRSDSWADSSAELDVGNACPVTRVDASARNAGLWRPPLVRVRAPDEHQSRIAIRTSAGTSFSSFRSSR